MSGDKAKIYDSLFRNSHDSIIVIDNEQKIVHMNDVAKKLFLYNIFDQNVKISDLLDKYINEDFKTYETSVKHNSKIKISVYQYSVSPSDRASWKVLIVKNITEYKHRERVLLKERECTLVALQCVHDAIIITDVNGVIDYLNTVAERLTGWSEAEAHGLPLTDVFTMVDETTRQPVENPAERCLREGKNVTSTHRTLLIQRSGQERVIEYTASPIRDQGLWEEDTPEAVVGAVLVCRDVTAMVGMARQMAHQASHDALTGLLNRHAFEARLVQALHSAKIERHDHVLCYLDLDQFKIVNDTCGHIAGDQLLKQLATLLPTRVRSSDTIGRLGGDEFGLLLWNCSIAGARQVAEGLQSAIRDFRFTWEEKTFDIGVSIGLVPITAASGDLAAVLRAADAVCYVAKEQGRNRIQVYQPDDTVLAQRHGEMQWVHRIRQALAEDRFCLYYQAIVPLARQDKTSVHGEILLRLVDEQGQLISPLAFIPAAERYHLMPTIDRWVIRHALAIMAHHRLPPNGKHTPMHIAINLSGQSLCEEQFLEFVIEQLQQSGVTPGRVCFEITETAAIANLTHALHFITALREIGCHFALDDFGSGLSSFAYLKGLPVDYLKIDGGFVRDMLDDPINSAIVNAINQIGHVMGIQTIAEFVENDSTLTKLRELGVDYAQGYGIARPEPLVSPAIQGTNNPRQTE
jgi:diguanylate cyclase (GGDEF)-like protein/PAS domain S-box-containing protein